MSQVIGAFERSLIFPGSVNIIIGRQSESAKTILSSLLQPRTEDPFMAILVAPDDDIDLSKDSVRYLSEWDADAIDKVLKARVSKPQTEELLFIVDHVDGETSLLKDKTFKSLLMNSRVALITTFVLVSSTAGLTTELKGQIDNLFLLPSLKRPERDRLSWFFNECDDQKQFDKVYTACTKPGRCLVKCNKKGVYWFDPDAQQTLYV